MAMSTNPTNRIVRISAEESADFIRKFNDGVPKTAEHLEPYESARKLFKRNGKTQNLKSHKHTLR